MSLLDQVPPPPQDWTATHEPAGIEGTVTERRTFETKSGDEFNVIVIQNGEAQYRVPLSRKDLRGLAEAREGDRAAIRYWGQQGSKFVYSYVIERSPEQGALEDPRAPVEEAPPPDAPDA